VTHTGLAPTRGPSTSTPTRRPGAVAAARWAPTASAVTDVSGDARPAKAADRSELIERGSAALIGDGTTIGGMIPKIETCLMAVQGGLVEAPSSSTAGSARHAVRDLHAGGPAPSRREPLRLRVAWTAGWQAQNVMMTQKMPNRHKRRSSLPKVDGRADDHLRCFDLDKPSTPPSCDLFRQQVDQAHGELHHRAVGVEWEEEDARLQKH